MVIDLNEVLSIYKASDLDAFIKKYSGKTLLEPSLRFKDIDAFWKYLGDNPSNGSSTNILGNGEKGLVERVTNAIDAVIEKQKIAHSISATTASSIIKVAFPKYYANNEKILSGESGHCLSYEAADQVILAVHDASRSTRPTFDIVDRGIGMTGDQFATTILSLNHGNKLSRDKQYLIGAFGQGGSTSLPFTYATIILSKKDGKYYWTVIKEVDLADQKLPSYVYLTIDGEIPEAEFTELDDTVPDYVKEFCDQDSGTIVRMVETEISKEYRDNEITKPRTLSDYINTQLFNVGLPVNLIDCRKNYADNAHTQDRNAYGAYMKLRTWKKYVHDEYSGTMNIEINGQGYDVDYYVILPPNEEDWAKDKKAEDTMRQFNVTGDPVIYTVNGQAITTESFTKIKNAGLNFLRNRLLVVINLDVLGMEKYKFFTSDRAKIKDTEKTHGFFDKVVKELSKVEKLIEVNRIIGEKAVSSSVDSDVINEISDEVKGEYNKFLRGGALIRGGGHRPPSPNPEEDYLDHIVGLDINMAKTTFYIDQQINVILKTGARKDVNRSSQIYMFVDNRSFYSATISYMNGRIQYTFGANATGFGKGEHTIKYALFDPRTNSFSMESNEVVITILNEKAPKSEREVVDRTLNLEIKIVTEAQLICDISKNEETKSILATLCLDGDQLAAEVYGLSASNEQIKELQTKIIKPIVLFALFQGDKYDLIESPDEKNRLIISLIKSIFASGVLV